MALEWGVLPLLMPSTADVEELWARTIETAREAGIIDPGDLVVLIAGTAVNLTGSTNVIKVERQRDVRAGGPRGPGGEVGPCCARRACSPWARSCSSASSTGSRSTATSTRRPSSTAARREVSRLETQQRQLKQRIATVGTGPDLVREARRLGFVKPGEQLFIVRGIAAWRARRRTTNLDQPMDDLAIVERQLGRPPRAFRRVAVRCPYGAPAVVEQEPFDADGSRSRPSSG